MGGKRGSWEKLTGKLEALEEILYAVCGTS